MATAFRSDLIIDNVLTVVATTEAVVVTRPFDVYDITVVGLVTVGGGTITVRRSTAAVPATFADVSTAIPAAVANAVMRAADLIDAQFRFATGDTLQFVPAGALNNMRTRISIMPNAIT